VFAPPVDQNGTTVIPVAKVRWGFGGGVGKKKGDNGEGGGTGGGVVATPVGYIELRDGVSLFRPIVDPKQVVLASALAVLLAGVFLRALRRPVDLRGGGRRHGRSVRRAHGGAA
jgi:hypothetical protein